jgi:GH24 family phage-related lysozyme (muramidase)
MKTSANGLKFIEEQEGLRLNVYLDSIGKPTIGVGHLVLPGEDFSGGITQEQAYTLLATDVAKIDEVLTRLAPNLTQNQHDALSSFGFNLGVGSLRMLLAHGIDQIPEQILRWDKAGGKEVPALLARRQRELSLFQS